MELLKSTKSKITKDENGRNMLHLEISEVVLIHYHIVNNNYRTNLRVMCSFVLNKSFGQLLYILPKNFIF